MRRSYVLNSIVAVAVLMFASAIVSAQTGQLRGSVKVIGADGNATPVVNAVIDVWRTDISGDYHTKTDKKGEWIFAGLPYVGVYVVSASAPGASPASRAGVKAGREIPVDLVLVAGNGKKFTKDEAVAGAGSGAPTSSGGGGNDAAEKAKAAELAKKNEEIRKANEKADTSNKVIGEKFKLGNDDIAAAQNAIKASNLTEAEKLYTEAIREFDEGLAADPNHPGAPSLQTNRAVAFRERGVLRYNLVISSDKYKEALKANDPSATSMLEPAKKDWKDAFESASKAVEMFKTQDQPTEPDQLANMNKNKYFALLVRAETANRFVTRVDASQVDAGFTAYQEYLAAETDPAKKSKVTLDLAQMLFDANAYDKAKIEYEKILSDNPDNPDALANMGLIFFNKGAAMEQEGKKDEAKPLYQQAANYLQRFVDKAPEGHKFKADAKAVLEEMKNQQNVQAEKTTTTPPRRKRP